MERLTAPDLIIIGGGISRKADKFVPLLTGVRAPVVPATLHNDAGIVGPAWPPGWAPAPGSVPGAATGPAAGALPDRARARYRTG